MGKNERSWEEIKGLDVWKPEEEGEQVTGEIIDVKDDPNYGKQYTLTTNEGSQVVMPSHKVLQNRLGKCEVGSIVRVTFTGEELPKQKGHSPTRLYKVERAL